MTDVEIFGGPHSNFVWSCRIACAEKGVPHTLIPAKPHSPEIDAINPLGKIPALRHGEVGLFESQAICFYIDHAFEGPRLVPADPLGGARVAQWVSVINTAFHPEAARPYFMGYFYPGTADGSPDRAAIDGALPKMAKYFEVFAQAVAPSGHLVGESFTLADICLVPILYYMGMMPESGTLLAGHPALKAYADRHAARPSVQATLPPPMPNPAK